MLLGLGDLALEVWSLFVAMPYAYHHWSLNTFYSVLDELDTGFYLSVALVVVWWWYCLLTIEAVTEIFELFWNEIAPDIWH